MIEYLGCHSKSGIESMIVHRSFAEHSEGVKGITKSDVSANGKAVLRFRLICKFAGGLLSRLGCAQIIELLPSVLK